MKTKIFTTVVLSGVMMVSGFSLAQAAEKNATTATVQKTPDLSKIIARADNEVDRRITALANLTTRVQAMKKVSDTDKAAFTAQIQNEQDSLTALKAKIDADTDLSTLRTDVKSITASYRIFALIIPRIQIVASSDRMDTIIATLKAIGAKFETRLNDAKASGKDTTALQKIMDDFTAKLSDASAQSLAAKNHVISLVPDNGDKNEMKTNTDALKLSRADIKTGQQDFKDIRKDAELLLKELRAFDENGTATTTVHAS